MPKFVHLHVHSTYSLLDGLSSIDGLIERALENDMPALAITDHGVLYGAIEFYERAKKNNIKAIIGMEAYLAPESRHEKGTRQEERSYHLVLIAKNHEGYKNLLQLSSIAHLEGYYYRPRIDWEILEKYHEGLIVLSACLQGPIPRRILSGRIDEARQETEKFVSVFGQDNFYLELQRHKTIPEQELVNKELIKFSKELGLGLVATNDSHYINKDDALPQDILLCIQNKKLLSDKDRMSFIGEDFSLKSPEQMEEEFYDAPQALENTVRISDACSLEIPLGKAVLPKVEVPQGRTPDEYLKYLCEEGVKNRYGDTIDKIDPIIKQRLEYELKVIKDMGFPSYFLIVQDFVNWAKSQGIVTGPGRGSAAGSIVSYLTNITNVDPIKYGLLFERFLNPERVSMPDIDLDFADVRRDEVVNYVSQKYGQDHVCQIITFGTMAARASIRDVGRVLGVSYEYCDKIAKLIPMSASLNQALEESNDLKKMYDSEEDAKKIIDLAKKLEGVARHSSRHACGVLITPSPLTQYVPLQYASSDDRAIVSQYSLHSVESLGLLKMDFLGLANLTIIQDAINLISKTKGIDIDTDSLPLDDKKTFELLKSGDTTGVFQLESGGMKRYLKQLKPTELNDIIAMVALYRPGPMELIPDYIAGKHGLKKITYLSPILEPILSETYGIAIYQEQIQRIACDFAGFTLGEGYLLVKAVAKKIKKLLDEQREKFIESAVLNERPKNLAEQLFNFIEPFARYGFNKSHATCYGIIAYQTAYLKANYPAQFMASLLSSDQDNIDRISIEIDECQRMGLEVLPPDVNESEDVFSVVMEDGLPTNRIRFGLKAIKNLGANISEAIILERNSQGPYKDLEDFLLRITSKDLNKKSLESLIKSGSLDTFGARHILLYNIDKLLNFIKNRQNGRDSGQTDLFSSASAEAAHLPKLKLEESGAQNELQELQWERELLGLFLSKHPLEEFQHKLPQNIKRIAEIKEHINHEGAEITTAGMIITVKRILTRSKQAMLFAKIEDQTGGLEVIVFPKILDETHALWTEGKMILISGKVSLKDQDVKILADKAFDLEELDPKMISDKGVVINLPILGATSDTFNILKKIFYENPGMKDVRLEIDSGIGKPQVIRTNSKIDWNDNVKKALNALRGVVGLTYHEK